MHRSRRRALIGLFVIAVVMITVRIVLNPVAAAVTRRVLADVGEYTGRFDSVSVKMSDLSYTIRGLELLNKETGHRTLALDEATISVAMLPLFGRYLTTDITVDSPSVHYIRDEAPEKELEELLSVADDLRDLAPTHVRLLSIRDANIVYVDALREGRPSLRLNATDLVVENIATREKLTAGRPTTLALSGTLENSGALSLFGSAALHAERPTFAGQLRLLGLELPRLSDFLAAASDLKIEEGSLDLLAVFEAANGVFDGSAQPLLHNVHLSAADSGLIDRLKAEGANLVVSLLESGPEDRDLVGTVVPIRGDLSDPDVQLWPTILGAVRNAFVEGLHGTFEEVPPGTSLKPEGLLSQARRAIGTEQWPTAQPTEIAPEQAEDPRVVASPAALYSEDALARIQAALVERGYMEQITRRLDEETAQAVGQFQVDHGLARTGLPNGPTVKEMDLQPKDVFRPLGTNGRG